MADTISTHSAPTANRKLRVLARTLGVAAVFFLGVLVGVLASSGQGSEAGSRLDAAPAGESTTDPGDGGDRTESATPDLLPPWSPGDGDTVSQVAVGALTSCALWNDGRLDCWGWGRSALAGAATPDHRFRAIAVGDTHACGITAEGATVCWGASNEGVPLEAIDATLLAVRGASPGPGQDIQQCGLRGAGVVCWVPDWQGPRITRTVDGNFSDFAVSSEQHLCTIDQGGVLECSGGLIPHLPPADILFSTVDLGWFHGCGLAIDGSIHCFGAHPELGDRADPVVEGAPAGSGFVAVSVGELDACAIRSDLSVECWGLRGFSTPADVRMRTIHVGVAHVCGIDVEGKPVCWGDDQHGQSSVPLR